MRKIKNTSEIPVPVLGPIILTSTHPHKKIPVYGIPVYGIPVYGIPVYSIYTDISYRVQQDPQQKLTLGRESPLVGAVQWRPWRQQPGGCGGRRGEGGGHSQLSASCPYLFKNVALVT